MNRQTVGTILVKSSDSSDRLQICGRQILDLALEPDSALEHIRRYFATTFGMTVHALRWLFPEDYLFSGEDRQPSLVLYVDEIDRRVPGSLVKRLQLEELPGELAQEAARMSQFEPWSGPDWLRNIKDWIFRNFGPSHITQIRVTPTGAVLKIRTSEGAVLFLKSVPSPFRYESKLIAVLDHRLSGISPLSSDKSPDQMTHVTVAVEGIRLTQCRDPDQWAAALNDFAHQQRLSAKHQEELRSTGLPSWSFDEFAAHLECRIADLIALQVDVTNRLSSDEIQNIGAVMERARLDAELIERCSIPDAIIHPDLSEQNIFRTFLGGTTLIDWTFARLGHPFFSPSLLFRVAVDSTHAMHKYFLELRDAYLEPWRRYSNYSCLQRGLDAASRLSKLEAIFGSTEYFRAAAPSMPGVLVTVTNLLRNCIATYLK